MSQQGLDKTGNCLCVSVVCVLFTWMGCAYTSGEGCRFSSVAFMLSLNSQVVKDKIKKKHLC